MIYKTESITVADTSVGFTAANLNLAESLYGRNIKRIVCTIDTAQLRYWEDGTDPTTSAGNIANIGDVITIDGSDARNFRAIRTGSTSSKIRASYEI